MEKSISRQFSAINHSDLKIIGEAIIFSDKIFDTTVRFSVSQTLLNEDNMATLTCKWLLGNVIKVNVIQWLIMYLFICVNNQ